MKIASILKSVLIGLFAVACLLVVGLISQPSQPASGKGVLPLQAPSFVNVAHAESAAPTAVSAIVDEAGISAYFQAPVSITISSVASLFRTIEFSNTDYIIGSMAVPNYDIYQDVHVYIHKNGYVLAYYLKGDPASKIFDWVSYNGVSINTTKLKNVLAIVASTAGSSFPGATYYDFRYPNATNLMLIAKGGGTFQINVPGAYVYYERGWSLYCTGQNSASWWIDGAKIEDIGCGGLSDGTLTAAQLLPDVDHTIEVNLWYSSGVGGLALIYRVP
jgi:hypothetical protein